MICSPEHLGVVPESQGLKAEGVVKYCGFHLLTDNGFLRDNVLKSSQLSLSLLEKNTVRNSLVVQCFGHGTFTAVDWVQPLVGELRSLQHS